ncbi:MAG TPA: hypothetical protein VGC97_22385 [Pyrinomonadaceae bacterium]
MKILFTVVMVALCSIAGVAQDDSIEKDFEKNKAKFKLEKFAEGEDATSGSDYLFYKNKSGFVKIRQAWTSGGYKEQRTDDYYFRDGKLILLVRYPRTKKQYKDAPSGKYLLLAPDEKFYFKDSKLITWIEKGKTAASDDARRLEKEKEILKEADEMMKYYDELKANR